jgi:hypothetical protein
MGQHQQISAWIDRRLEGGGIADEAFWRAIARGHPPIARRHMAGPRELRPQRLHTNIFTAARHLWRLLQQARQTLQIIFREASNQHIACFGLRVITHRHATPHDVRIPAHPMRPAGAQLV